MTYKPKSISPAHQKHNLDNLQTKKSTMSFHLQHCQKNASLNDGWGEHALYLLMLESLRATDNVASKTSIASLLSACQCLPLQACLTPDHSKAVAGSPTASSLQVTFAILHTTALSTLARHIGLQATVSHITHGNERWFTKSSRTHISARFGGQAKSLRR